MTKQCSERRGFYTTTWTESFVNSNNDHFYIRTNLALVQNNIQVQSPLFLSLFFLYTRFNFSPPPRKAYVCFPIPPVQREVGCRAIYTRKQNNVENEVGSRNGAKMQQNHTPFGRKPNANTYISTLHITKGETPLYQRALKTIGRSNLLCTGQIFMFSGQNPFNLLSGWINRKCLGS